MRENSGCIESFGDRIAAMAERFLGEKGFDHIDELVLTGGGNNIPMLRSAIQKRFKKRGVKLTHVPQSKTSEESTKTLHRLDKRLVRGGSALGGASVFFDNLFG